MPGFIATDAAMQNMSEDFLKMFLKNVPLNRPGQPEDIANAVLFFASDMSSFVTGETMPVAVDLVFLPNVCNVSGYEEQRLNKN